MESAAPNPEASAESSTRGFRTILFTDLAGSTRVKQSAGEQRAAEIFRAHHAALRGLLAEFADAREVETAGDSFLIVFEAASSAVRFAARLHDRNQGLAKELGEGIEDRVGIHVGEVDLASRSGANRAGVFGISVDICARVMGLASPGQVLMTRPVFDNARQALKHWNAAEPVRWFNHGPYALKGIDEPIEICEVRSGGAGEATPPKSSDKAHRLSAEGDLVLGWRPAVNTAVPETRWVLTEKLGEGGFGEVWLARHEKLKDNRVFKFCFKADRVRALKREMTLFRVLKEHVGDHPNIVRLHDVFLEEPPYYLQMEHVEGGDLRRWARLPRSLEQKVEVVAQIGDALHAAHRAGILHRDLKPGNILVADGRDDGKPLAKLADFGIGQVLSEEFLAGVTQAGFTMTLLGSTSSHTGTQLYMAPELMAGKPASPQSDIYSLGVVLFQLLANDFSRPLTTDWTEQIEDSLLRADLQRCFAGKPSERFASAGELAERLRDLPARRQALERQQAEQAARERGAYRKGLARATLAFALVLVAMVALSLSVYNQSLLARIQTVQAKQEARRADNERTRANTERTRALRKENDALRLLYAANMNLAQGDWHDTNISRLTRLLEQTRSHPERGWEWNYLEGLLRLREAKRDGAVLQSGPAAQLVFAGDGKSIVVLTESGAVLAYSASTGEKLHEILAGGAQLISMAKGGRLLAVRKENDGGALAIWEEAGRGAMRTVPFPNEIRALAVMPDGAKFVTGHGSGELRFWSAMDGSELAAPRPISNALPVIDLAIAPDGEMLGVATERGASLYPLKQPDRTIELPGCSGLIAFSSDGKSVLSLSTNGVPTLYSTTSGQPAMRLEGHRGAISAVAFTANGNRAVTASLDGTVRVWDAESGRELLVLGDSGQQATGLEISEDGSAIAVLRRPLSPVVWSVEGEGMAKK